MKKIKTAIFLLLSFCSHVLLAQLGNEAEVNALVEKGIALHDNHEFEKAIEVYHQALNLDPKSSLIHYELSLSYFRNKQYQKAIEYSDKVLKANDKYLKEAYITKGSCLDLLGKTKESIKLLKKGIKKFGDDNLLHYNLALNYYKLRDLDNAEKYILEAIKAKSSHSSSHLVLGYIHYEKGNKTQSLLPIHYFLFLEPNSKRATQAYGIMVKQFSGNVSKDQDKPNSININLSMDNKSEFSSAELLLSLSVAANNTEKGEGKSSEELFIDNTKSYFSYLGEMEEGKKSIWWDFYIPFYAKLANSEHIDTYCYYISQSTSEKANEWLKDNPSRISDLDDWIHE